MDIANASQCHCGLGLFEVAFLVIRSSDQRHPFAESSRTFGAIAIYADSPPRPLSSMFHTGGEMAVSRKHWLAICLAMTIGDRSVMSSDCGFIDIDRKHPPQISQDRARTLAIMIMNNRRRFTRNAQLEAGRTFHSLFDRAMRRRNTKEIRDGVTEKSWLRLFVLR